RTRHRLFPGLQTHADAPSGALRAYGKVLHTSRPLMALMALLSLVALGMAVLMLLGAAATAGFALRYLVPLVSPIAIAATLSVELLVSPAAGRWGRSVSHQSSHGADRH
ncbi:MAG: hypothetical protein QOH13_849, partial [Thermoleophilaceae bacterium]|nr:hypothetical protein [Thermoleophilaceae bacterium]